MAWAVVLIWAGVALLIFNNTNLLDNLPFLEKIGQEGWTSPAWSLILVGAGFIFLLEVIVRLIVPAYRRPIFGSLIFSIFLIGGRIGQSFQLVDRLVADPDLPGSLHDLPQKIIQLINDPD